MSRSLANLLSRRSDLAPKVHVEPVTWEKAWNDYDPESIQIVWNRCTKDVIGHKDVHDDQFERGYLR